MNKFNAGVTRRFGAWYVKLLMEKAPKVTTEPHEAMKQVDDVVLSECSSSVFDMTILLNVIMMISLLAFGFNHDDSSVTCMCAIAAITIFISQLKINTYIYKVGFMLGLHLKSNIVKRKVYEIIDASIKSEKPTAGMCVSIEINESNKIMEKAYGKITN